MPGVELGQAFVPIRADLDPLKKDLNNAHDSISSKLGGAMQAAATTMAVAGVAAGAAIAAVGVSSIQAASDVNESLSKVGVVFGDSAAGIEAWAATASTSMGQSRGEALAAAGTLGNLFVSMGLGSKDAAGLSTEMIELAGDLGSFNNIASSDALEKLRAGLIGEAEPLRALGVNMNAAMVEAKGMELGLADASGELSEAAKVQARYAIIMEQTTTAQGDFARTSTGMANATKIIQASLGDLQVQIGDQLLPIIAPLISSFAQWLPEAIKTVQPILVEVGKVFGEVIAIVGTTLEGITSLARGWHESSAGVSEQTGALWRYLEPVFDALARNLAVFWEVIFPELEQTWAAVVENLQRATAAFAGWWDEHWTTISKVLDLAMVVITTAIDVGFSSIKALISVVLNLIQGDWQGAWDAITDHFGVVWAGLQRVAGAALPLIQEALASAWDGIRHKFVESWATFTGSVQAGFTELTGRFERAGAGFMDLLRQGITSRVDGVLAPIRKMVADVAALLPHSYADEGPLSEPVSWIDVLMGDLAAVMPATVAVFEVGAQLIEGEWESLRTVMKGQREAISAELETLQVDFAETADAASSAAQTIASASGASAESVQEHWNPVSSNDLASAVASFQNQQHAAMLNAGTAASGIGAGGVGAGIVGAQSITLELDGQVLGRAIAPYTAPETTRWSGTRIEAV